MSLDLFHSWISEVELTKDFIQRYVSLNQSNYQRHLICRTWSLTVYVISWMPGQESWLHHHGYSLGAIKVIQGQMTHWLVPPGKREEGMPFEDFDRPRRHEGPSEVFSSGELVSIDRRHGHQIANLSDEPLVTLHFRFGHPSEDKHWRSTNDTEMFVWNQTEGCFDLVGPIQRRSMSPLS